MDFRPNLDNIVKAYNGAQVYYVPVRGPPGPPGKDGEKGESIKGEPGKDGTDGQDLRDNGINYEILQALQLSHTPNPKKGKKGEKGEKGDKGDKGDTGGKGVVEHDFTKLILKYGKISDITDRPQAIITNGMEAASWGVEYESNPGKLVTVLLLYQNSGLHRVQFQSIGVINQIYMLYNGDSIISKNTKNHYIDLPGAIDVKEGTTIMFTIRWGNE